ncbi:MAG: tryptophan 7-halogenase, partial [Pseudomonadota bacterium]
LLTKKFEQVRDFIILHYYLNEREDSQFWRDVRHSDVPDRVLEKVALFKANGTLTKDNLDIFLEPSWLQVMLGQGIEPEDYHPLANNLTDAQLRDKLAQTKATKLQPLEKIPSHDAFLEAFCKAG